jgi:5,10-methylenetetrahydromethanopterin reductase
VSLKFSLRLNSDLCGVRRAVELAETAEKAGFDIFWYCQDLFKRDAWIVLSAAAMSTERIGLGTAIVNPYTSHVSEIAMRAATLQELSGGRFHLGIGVGAPETLEWAGIHVSKPVTGLVQAVKELKLLFSNELDGTREKAFLRFDYGRYNIPIYIGGQGKRLAHLMGELGDGGLPLLVPPEAAGRFLNWIREGAEKVSRDVSSLDISGCIWYCIGERYDDIIDNHGLRKLTAYYGPMLSDELLATAGLSREVFKMVDVNSLDMPENLITGMMKMAVTGTFDDVDGVVRRLRTLQSLGLTHFNIGPPLGDDPAKVLEFTAEVIKRIKSR